MTSDGNYQRFMRRADSLVVSFASRSFAYALAIAFGLIGPSLAIGGEAAIHSDASQSAGETNLSKSQLPIFDWSQELIVADVPEVGHRFTRLSYAERKSLRQGFKLPLDAIAKSESISDLSKMAMVRPLPDPSKPFIPVKAEIDTSSNPFDPSVASNDLGPLGRMFALEGTAAKTTSALQSSSSASTDPFGSDDPFASDSTVTEATQESATPAENSASETADPFDAMDGGFEDDPFADF